MENNEKLLNEEVIENVNYEVDYDDDNYTEEDIQNDVENGAKDILKVVAIGTGIVGAGVLAYKKIIKPRLIKHFVKEFEKIEVKEEPKGNVEETKSNVENIEEIRQQYDYSKDKE